MSPVFWKPDRLKDYQAFLDLNPFYHLLEAVRAPLLGTPVAPGTYLFLVGMAVAGWLVTFLIFARTRRRIVHYL
jgi:ABC-type polysaccharide/polyol phosphate export permease